MRDLMLKAAAWQQARQPREEGQTVVEYALVVALVSLVIIGVLATVGKGAINAVGDEIDAALGIV
ncbi:MAG: Flp family type IVb pilin [Chloroflexi bacterium]|nr:Flp family type IVb pilin [Chloroflexota bacterium]MCZ7575711.1 Flp family type IVb pilin [Dehalococcoidia bacterium]